MDIVHNLSGPWSSVAGLLTQGSIDDVEKIWQSAGMEELQKARLVVSPLFMRKADLESLHTSLMRLHDVASKDTGEWVHMLSIAVDGYDGRIHTDKVLQEVPMVREAIDNLVDLAKDIDPSLYRPLEEKYLTDSVLKAFGSLEFVSTRRNSMEQDARRGHSHFIVRENTVVPSRNQPSSSIAPKANILQNPGNSGFGSGIPQRKRPHSIQQQAAMPLVKKSKPDVSLFLKSSTPKTFVGSKGPQKKKAAILDISALEQARKVNEERREKLLQQKEEEKEKEAKARAEAHEAEKKAKEERKHILKESAKKKKEELKQKERDEKKKALEDAKARKEEERQRKKRKTPKESVDSKDVAVALDRARLKADMESTKEIENLDAFDARHM